MWVQSTAMLWGSVATSMAVLAPGAATGTGPARAVHITQRALVLIARPPVIALQGLVGRSSPENTPSICHTVRVQHTCEP